ncbi:MAG: DivIVA domain-containing protein [Lachnospiraceae bacterium]|nr:DivIVA domain-containing protein [Lachnospiraceae bacterium]
MLTPVDVQNKSFKGGIGFDKKEVETFMSELSADYEMLYRSNVELKDKVTTLNESLQHYRSIEDSMKKALTLSQKTAEETINAANDKARQITTEAEKKAETILADAKEELSDTKNEIYRLQQQHAKFKAQFTKVLESQLKIMDGEMVDIDLGPDFEGNSYSENGYGNFSGGGLGSEGGLGGFGGGYVGSGSDGFERTNQDPTFSHGTLNMDPFADAASGGGRFSRQTGGAYNGNSSKKSTGNKKTENKSSLNVKQVKPGANKVKKNFNTVANDSKTSAVKQSTTAKVSEQVKPEPVKSQPVKPQTMKPHTDASILHTQAAVKSVTSTGNTRNMQTSAGNYQNTSTVTAKPQTSKTSSGTTQSIPSKPQRQVPPAKESVQVSGEVEDRINEATMLDSEDNYNAGFDFVEEESATSYEFQETSAGADNHFDSDTVSGEVEDRINESTMLDSEDNYNTGFDFVSEETYSSYDSLAEEEMNTDEDTYVGEVEDKINESTMLDSEDNYNDGFDFVVGNEEEEEIPTISQGLNIDPFHENKDDEVFVGDVEDNLNKSTLIGNADDEEDGFNFL